MIRCQKSPHVRRFDDTFTDAGMVQFTTTMAYYNLLQTRRLQAYTRATLNDMA